MLIKEYLAGQQFEPSITIGGHTVRRQWGCKALDRRTLQVDVANNVTCFVYRLWALQGDVLVWRLITVCRK